jgi:hypothetical protein
LDRRCCNARFAITEVVNENHGVVLCEKKLARTFVAGDVEAAGIE